VTRVEVSFTVNGRRRTVRVLPRMTLVDCLRDEIGLTGTHVGCEQGVCGACSILLDGEAVRACLVFAVQVEGQSVTTVEGLAAADGTLSPLQEAFWDHHAMQCGYCTPGMLIAATALLAENRRPSDEEIRDAIGGNLCRCTGYQQIVEAIADAAGRTLGESGDV
jgi:carbon-monoxide dehydrogenase small subunit